MKFDKRFWGIGLGILAMILRYILSLFPQAVETLYSRGLYKVVRVFFDSIHWVLPFSALYLLVALLLVSLYFGFKKWRRSERTFLGKSGQALFSLLSLVGWIVFLFLFLWGYNYGRIPMATQLKIAPKPLKLATVVNELKTRETELIELRSNISGSLPDKSFSLAALPENMEEHLRQGLENQLLQLGYPRTGFPTVRTGYPKGVIWGFGAIGFYNPFTGECNVDPCLLYTSPSPRD